MISPHPTKISSTILSFFAGSAFPDVVVVLRKLCQPEDYLSGEIWALTQRQFLKGKDRAKKGSGQTKETQLKNPIGLELGISADG